MQNSRLRSEKEYIEENEDKLPDHIKYKVNDDSLRSYTIQITGLKGTNLEGAFIVADVNFGPEFPKKPPQIILRNDFRHVNVYTGDHRLCMYLINDLPWICTTRLLDIILGFNEVLHHPAPHDPANGELSLLHKSDVVNNTNELDKQMRLQTQKFKDPKYKVL